MTEGGCGRPAAMPLGAGPARDRPVRPGTQRSGVRQISYGSGKVGQDHGTRTASSRRPGGARVDSDRSRPESGRRETGDSDGEGKRRPSRACVAIARGRCQSDRERKERREEREVRLGEREGESDGVRSQR